MAFRLASLRPAHLLVGWCSYWLTLVLLTIGPGLPALWRVTREDAHGSVSASFGDGLMKLVVSEGGATVWSRSIGFIPMIAAIGIPPLLLWALWLRAQRKRRDSSPVV